MGYSTCHHFRLAAADDRQRVPTGDRTEAERRLNAGHRLRTPQVPSVRSLQWTPLPPFVPRRGTAGRTTEHCRDLVALCGHDRCKGQCWSGVGIATLPHLSFPWQRCDLPSPLPSRCRFGTSQWDRTGRTEHRQEPMDTGVPQPESESRCRPERRRARSRVATVPDLRPWDRNNAQPW